MVEGVCPVKAADNDNRALSEVIETRTSRMWLGEDGIGRVVLKPGVEETLEDVKEIIKAGLKHTKGVKILAINDIRNAKSITREAREFYAGKETAKLLTAIALLVGSPVSRSLGNFYISVNRPICPTRLFTSEQKAIKWLKGFL
jgi:hypothetical protein